MRVQQHYLKKQYCNMTITDKSDLHNETYVQSLEFDSTMTNFVPDWCYRNILLSSVDKNRSTKSNSYQNSLEFKQNTIIFPNQSKFSRVCSSDRAHFFTCGFSIGRGI